MYIFIIFLLYDIFNTSLSRWSRGNAYWGFAIFKKQNKQNLSTNKMKLQIREKTL